MAEGGGWPEDPHAAAPARWGALAFAGLHDVWRAPSGEKVGSCTILTTTANEVVAAIHDRMPVMLPRGGSLRELLTPLSAGTMAAYPVSGLVNSVTNDESACIEPGA